MPELLQQRDRSFPTPGSKEGWDRGIESWGVRSGSVCDLGGIAAPLWACVRSVVGCRGVGEVD